MRPKWKISFIGGFTIVEVMIFLAVTGGLFIISFLAFNGQQQRTQFTQSVRDTESKIQDIINEVNNGYFPSNIDNNSGLTCNNNTSTTSQGTNKNCIFVGKVVEIKPSEDKLIIHTIVGRRRTPQNKEVTTLDEAQPTIFSTIDEEYNTKYTEDIVKAFSPACQNSGTIKGFAILTTFGTYQANPNDPSDNNFLGSGAINADIIPICQSDVGIDLSGQNQYLSGLTESLRGPRKNIGSTICFKSLYDDRYGAVVVGEDSQSTKSILGDNIPSECST